ncbi:alpha-galactosidase [Ornithobacterium rhinotracheale]|uniref:alpha-galactosidase n=1 Tax=Ornithobacterium rhinotracheale TaxID=28251 RepID=UPI004036EA68
MKKIAFILGLAGAICWGQNSTQPSPPIMGWASWNNYRNHISDSIIKRQTDYLVKLGLNKIGYQYINIDDGFFDGRNPDGSLNLNKERFPNGLKPIAEYIHSKGLKAGIYSDVGPNTCASIWDKDKGGVGAGLYQNERKDLEYFINDLKFDFIKVDYCGASQQDLKLDEEQHYTYIKKMLDSISSRKIGFNVCRWQFPGSWVTSLADSWRISGDIANTFHSMTEIVDLNTFLAPYMSPGHYNDMDMLQIGRGLSYEEDKAQMSMWSILTSPLMLGNDLSQISDETLKVISNTEIIAVNQDMTEQGKLISNYKDPLQVWSKKLNGINSGERAVVLFNRTKKKEIIWFNFSDLELKGGVSLRDLWGHKDIPGKKHNRIGVWVPPHGVVALKLKGEFAPKYTYEAEYAYLHNYNLTQNTKVLPNQAKHAFNEKASRHALVTNLGGTAGNYIEFRKIFSPKNQTQELVIHYFAKEPSIATLSVNGGKSYKIEFQEAPNGGKLSLKVPLKKGFKNSIKIENDENQFADLDKIEIL